MTICDSCQRAIDQSEITDKDGVKWTRGHSCSFRYGEQCECPRCHPAGSFKISASITLESDAEIDVAAFVRADLDQYRSLDMGGYEEWERPMVLLWAVLEEEWQPLFDPDNVRVYVATFNIFERNWSTEKFEALCVVCPEARIEASEATVAPGQITPRRAEQLAMEAEDDRNRNL